MLPARINMIRTIQQQQIFRSVSKSRVNAAEISPPKDQTGSGNAEPSERMQEFRKKLTLDPVPRVSPGMRFIDLMLVKTNPNTGELISDAEKDPTKWGDWQIGGRVSDF